MTQKLKFIRERNQTVVYSGYNGCSVYSIHKSSRDFWVWDVHTSIEERGEYNACDTMSGRATSKTQAIVQVEMAVDYMENQS